MCAGGPAAPQTGESRNQVAREQHDFVRQVHEVEEVEEAMMQEAMYQSLVVHDAVRDDDPDLRAALSQSLKPTAPPDPGPTEESLRLQALLDTLGMKRLDVGSTNVSEGGALLSNQCFYLAIARSWLASVDNGSGMLVRDSALQLKREIEACVFCVRGDAGRELGDEAEAYTDYLSCVVQAQSPASASAITDLAIAIFASSLGGIEAYEGRGPFTAVKISMVSKSDRSAVSALRMTLQYHTCSDAARLLRLASRAASIKLGACLAPSGSLRSRRRR